MVYLYYLSFFLSFFFFFFFLKRYIFVICFYTFNNFKKFWIF